LAESLVFVAKTARPGVPPGSNCRVFIAAASVPLSVIHPMPEVFPQVQRNTDVMQG
jgi:hypothetical protein